MNEQDERIRLAEILLEEAEHSSEAAIRASISRAYYAVHHLGIALTGKADHGEIRNRLRQRDVSLGNAYGELLELRSKADYTPGWLAARFGGDLNRRRIESRDILDRARELFERLRDELRGADANG